MAVPAGPVAYAPVVAPLDYTLDSGDRLRVVVFGQEGLTNAYLVDAAGCIDVPLIGQVLARGATTEELASRIAAKLRNGFIREPHVAVEVVVYRPFFILGEVTAPGQLSLCAAHDRRDRGRHRRRIHAARISQKPDRRSPGRRPYRAHVGAAELPDPAGRHRQRARALVLIGNPGSLQIALTGLA
jgi:protein involved in polysaccharide export with SLBB domain